MIQEPFATGSSVLHGIDPRLRVSAALFYSFAVALSYDIIALFLALFLSILLTASAQLGIKMVVKRLLVLTGFLALLWGVLPLTYKGEIYFKIGPFAFSKPGIMLTFQITLKSISLVMAFMALLGTMSTAVLGHTLNRMKLPDKMVHLFLITYRYIFVLEQEYQRLIRATRIRNFQPKTSMHSYRTYAYLVGMLFVRASERARRVHHAMICRGFNGRFYALHHFPPRRSNIIFSIIITLYILALLYIEIASKIG